MKFVLYYYWDGFIYSIADLRAEVYFLCILLERNCDRNVIDVHVMQVYPIFYSF